jgi:DNA primase
VHARPDFTTGGLIEHFADREEGAALQKLAGQPVPGDGSSWRDAFFDAMNQLDRQTLQQRIEELQEKWRAGGKPSSLTPEEHAELKELQALVARRT